MANKDMLLHLDQLIGQQKRRGTNVQFWKVPREWNALADALAGASFLKHNVAK